jgi:hypothetical protein
MRRRKTVIPPRIPGSAAVAGAGLGLTPGQALKPPDGVVGMRTNLAQLENLLKLAHHFSL